MSRKTGFTEFLKLKYAEHRQARSADSTKHWFDQRQTLFKLAKDEWNSDTVEMSQLRQSLSQQAQEANLQAKRKRESIQMDQSEGFRAQQQVNKRIEHEQQSILNTSLRIGMLFPEDMANEDVPSLVKPHALVDYGHQHSLTPFSTDQAGKQVQLALTDLNSILEDSEIKTIKFLLQTGRGLHGFGSQEYGLSETIVEHASHTCGFVKRSQQQLRHEHSSVCSISQDLNFDIDTEDENMQNLISHSCQQLCGRYCRSNIRKSEAFQQAVYLVKSIVRSMAKRRTVKLGKNWFLGPGPTSFFPVMIVSIDDNIYGFLACRISFKPQEVDWISCTVRKDVDQSLHCCLMFHQESGCYHRPVCDTTNEFAVWFSQMYKPGISVQVFWQYKLVHPRRGDIELVLDSTHESVKTTLDNTDCNDLDELFCLQGGASSKDADPDASAVAMVTHILKKMNSNSEKTKRNANTKKTHHRPVGNKTDSGNSTIFN